MTLVARIQGQVENADQLINILTTVKADNEASLRAAQIERFVISKLLNLSYADIWGRLTISNRFERII